MLVRCFSFIAHRSVRQAAVAVVCVKRASAVHVLHEHAKGLFRAIERDAWRVCARVVCGKPGQEGRCRGGRGLGRAFFLPPPPPLFFGGGEGEGEEEDSGLQRRSARPKHGQWKLS